MGERLSLNRDEISRRLDFIQFTTEDAERIRSLRPFLEDITEEVADELYLHIRRIPELAEILQGHVNQCKTKQAGYLRQLLEARIDDLYTASRAWVGEVHRHMGVKPAWYVAGFSFLLELLLERVGEHLQDDPARGLAVTRSLMKLVSFDMILALDSYSQGLEQVDRNRTSIMRDLAAPVLLEVLPGVLVLPLTGPLDSTRVSGFYGAILQAVAREVRVLIFDLSRLLDLDAETGTNLFETLCPMAQELGTSVVVAGLGAVRQRELTQLGVSTDGVALFPRLHDAVQHALDSKDPAKDTAKDCE